MKNFSSLDVEVIKLPGKERVLCSVNLNFSLTERMKRGLCDVPTLGDMEDSQVWALLTHGVDSGIGDPPTASNVKGD